ncbi:methionine synthase [Halostagnicola sp. A-GB9-2]|uniref:methionine synthase n=1 Tax=Halostagnicola sp. A-GB9-2 TaxID=3048066 RepID=UPI0024BFF20C|nr:methionine synthase [Halostagnicola sp. A-GB9-2]MDJ1430742.1 methionine synthase [Halostagnicola sp. A-GB9-2]
MTAPAPRDQFRPADHPNDHFLLTTIVGAYPKPTWHNRARELFEDSTNDFGRSEWKQAKDDAARLVTAEHERAGIDVVTDGEMRRNEMVEYFAERIEGYEFNGLVKVWGHNYFDKPSVRREVEYGDSWLVDEYEFTSEVASGPVKVPITGPYTLATWCFNEVYEDDAALAADLAELVNAEIRTLVDAGARYIQIDEAALATTPEDYAIVGECLETVVEDLPEDVYIGLHVCYGDYSRIYPEILEFPVDEFDLELNNDDYGQLEVFKEPTFTKNLGFGVVDVHTAEIETVEEIKANIERGLEVVPPERLTISPDCGLKLLPRDVAYGKMENMVQAAREIEAELDEGTLGVPGISIDD